LLSAPLTLQSHHTILLDSAHPDAETARAAIAPFAELVKTPGPLHHYRLTPLSLWNAAAAGINAPDILAALKQFSAHDIPPSTQQFILTHATRYGRIWIEDMVRSDDFSRYTLATKVATTNLALRSTDPLLLNQLANRLIPFRGHTTQPLLTRQLDEHTWLFDWSQRGALKQALLKLGYPVHDRAAYRTGASLSLQLHDAVTLRHYQHAAIERVVNEGSGVVVLPCGAGKTLVGIGLMAQLQSNTLILAPSIVAARQWASELRARTTIHPDLIGEYSGERKDVRPITIATYQILTQNTETVNKHTGELIERPHLALFTQNDWGLVIYDEVHLLPAPIFRLVAEIQAMRRLGLTATLVREDGCESDVFALIGPARYQAAWKTLEREGWIATATCTEVRIEMEEEERLTYIKARKSEQARIAGENIGKLIAAQKLVAQHHGDHILIIGQYLAQLRRIAQTLHAPLITGHTPNAERERLYTQFRRGDSKVLVVSKVANYAVDLPDANVAIQVSGTFGSRQEEAQRLGRVLRPKANGAQAHFYTLVTQDTIEQHFAAKRQRFLIEQGYEYSVISSQ
jgi:DNA excision repair protein ERCC-3